MFDNSYKTTYYICDIGVSLFFVLISAFLEDLSILLFMIVYLIMIRIRLKKNIHNSLMSIDLLFSLIIEIISFLISTYMGRIIFFFIKGIWKADTLENFQNILIPINIVLNIAVFIFLIYIMKFKKNEILNIRERIVDLKLEHNIFGLLLFVFLSFESILLVGDLEYITISIQGTIILSFTLLLILMMWQMLAFIKDYSIKQETHNEIEQNEQLNDYLESVSQQYDSLRDFKHDFKNIMLSMNASNGKDIDQYKEYYNEIINQDEYQSSVDGEIVGNSAKLKNSPLRGLIIQKYLKSKAKGINIDFEISSEIFIREHVLTVVRVVGILLDNAIEASSTTTGNITCAFIDTDGTKEISVENGLINEISLKDIFKNGYSTKGNNRGIGLYNIKKLINKNPSMYFESEIVNKHLIMTLIIDEG